jgi:signal transduction histidine kinase
MRRAQDLNGNIHFSSHNGTRLQISIPFITNKGSIA